MSKVKIKPLIYKGKETYYFISEYGEIFDEDMEPLKYYENKKGYKTYSINVKSKRRRVSAHVGVAETFIGHIPDGYQVHHKDHNPRNNHVSNLQIVTASENMKYAVKAGHVKSGEDATLAKYSEKLVRKICKLLKEGYSRYEICKKLDVNYKLVSNIASKRTWASVSEEYDLPDVPSRKHKYLEVEEYLIVSMRLDGMKYKKIALWLDSTESAIKSKCHKLKKEGKL